ncbi:MAG: CCA tRNA nucleotidyltransferase [Candidatus Sumerlaeia bacterium]|nr:CCA tRNA nucleotidyltransferase [Candidatus Sumerlaeia bacterium]
MVDAARAILRTLRQAGHEAWWVGGCVRDALLGRPVKDVDIATDARPEQIAGLFNGVRLVGASFGVCVVPVGDGRFCEVATFRRDGRYIDLRRPESVSFGTREDDARRRDFTINAIYHDPDSGAYFDPTGGREDLACRLVRTVGDPIARFSEDALRLLRAVRFAARLKFEIETGTWEALVARASTISAISPERIRDELTLMLTGPHPARAVRLLDEAGLLGILLPEIAALKGVEQSPVHHPEGDVYVHTLAVMDALEDASPVAAWAALLHDIGKPATREVRDDGRITFYGHDVLGAEMAAAICRRLRFPGEEADRITAIVGRHMRFMDAHQWNASTMRRFLSAPTIREDLAVHRADCLASHGKLDNWVHVRDRLEGFVAREEPVLPPPLVTGRDLIALGLAPGPAFRRILNEVLDAQMEGRLAGREEALEWVRARFGTGGEMGT